MAEPLPGYRLIERLGGGGFGEVWKAEAPGGLFKAIKFVYGDLDSSDEDSARAEQERKALCRLIEKNIRHAFILSLERIEIVDKRQLIIVSELADRTLWDRFRECRAQGMQGIPREELLGYLSDTAEALDFMNATHQLQHLDIKPQNLFLVHNHVKVADFGLVKLLEGMTTNVTGGVTPVYAAPETFEGKVSRFSDQYSLAIVYEELLTGHRPYSGTTLRQLVMQHCQGTPDLKPLPEHDRPVVLRALAKKHVERFPSCLQFLDSLRQAALASERPAAAKKSGASPIKALHTSQDGPKTESRPTVPAGEESWPQPVAARDPQPVAARHPTPTKSQGDTPRQFDSELAPGPQKPIDISGQADGVLVPALVIGLGQFGMGTLRRLRQEICDHYGSANILPAIRFLYIDTDPDSTQRAVRGPDSVALRPSEVVLTRLQRPSHYLKPHQNTTGLETWLHPKMLYRMPRQQTSSGIRALGRLALVDHWKTVSRRVQAELQGCCSREALERTCADTGLNVRVPVPRVYLVANLGGGAGSGMLIDLAYLAQHQLQQLGHDKAEVCGLCFLPAADKDARRTPQLANAFAALTELNYFNTPQRTFSARYELGEVRPGGAVFSWRGPPLQRCKLFSLPQDFSPVSEDASGAPTFPSALAGTLATAARCVFNDLLTPLGRVVDGIHKPASTCTVPDKDVKQGKQPKAFRPALFQLAAMDRWVWPRRQLLDLAAANICRRLVQRWMTKDARNLRDTVKQWVRQKWEEQGLASEQIIDQYLQGCEKALGEAPEAQFKAIYQNVIKALGGTPDKIAETPNLAVIVDALQQYEQIVGIPEEFQNPAGKAESGNYEPGTLERALPGFSASIVEHHEQKMDELAVRLIEDPAFRLAGAEEALRQLHGQVEQALQAHERLSQELQGRAIQIWKRLHQFTAAPAAATTPAMWKSARSSGNTASTTADILELLRAYPKVRYQALLMQRISSLYVGLRGQLTDQLREVDYCRARLGELLEWFATNSSMPSEAPAAGRYLFDGGCATLSAAVTKLDTAVGPADLVELDGRIQALIRKQFKALVMVCMSAANVLRALAPAMQRETRSYLRSRMGEIDVAEIFLKQFGQGPSAEDSLLDQLTEGFERAAPEVIASPPAQEHNFLTVPPGPSEERIRDLAAEATSEKPMIAVTAHDEIAVYREHTLACLADLKQLGPAGQEAYDKMTAMDHFTPHCRSDIAAWGTRAEAAVH
jgi:serine/threonine protein kinase